MRESLPTTRAGMSLWHHPDFLRLWLGQTVSTLGSHITDGGLPLLAVITLQASPLQMGLLSAIGSAPVLLFSLFAGVWVDRLRRRRLMIIADLGRALILATIPLAAVFGRLGIGQIYLVIALTGILTVVFNTAYRAYLPTLIQPERILEGNSKLAVSDSAAEIIGPGLTGLLVQTITAPIAILFDALSFLVSVISVALIHSPEPPIASRSTEGVLQEAREGILTVVREPALLALMGSAATRNFFGSMIGVLYALYAIRDLHITPAAMGLTIGLGGASSLVGALLAERFTQRFGLGPTLVGTVLVDAGFVLLIPIAASAAPYGLVLLLVAQAGDIAGTIHSINAISLRQSIAPARLLGRVNASMELLIAGAAPLGALLGGFLGDRIGVQPALFIAVFGIAFSSLWLAFSPIRLMKGMPAGESN